MIGRTRCAWSTAHPLLTDYHDGEWGVPLHDDRRLFEFLVLDAAQAGLSWLTVLKKREGYRAAFDGFDPEKVARYGPGDIGRLLVDGNIIRNRLKIESAVHNAKALLDLREETGDFDSYVWGFTGGRTVVNAWRREEDIPCVSPESETMSRDMKKRGFKFAGPTICYAFMQAAGMVNDHIVGCFRYEEVQRADF